MSSSALRRLSNDDVKTVFDCVYNNKIPSNKKLQFKIIVVGPQGMKLSPPSYEFDDGLYILLRPLKKHEKQISTKPEDDPRIPHNLRCLVFTDYIKETCPWSLSGPQFPVPTSIQQRYCYPKGSPEYSHTKGGALWTVYDENGKEDLDFRLLHVYYSAKRAGNRGKSWSSTYSSSRKRRSEVPPSVDLQNTPSIDVGSLASASFDSPLSFKIPSSPVDPGIFRNVFKKLSASDDKFDTNDNEPIITPDRSIFDLNPSVDHQRDSRYPSLSQKEQQKEHPRQTNSLSYHPSSHHSHYYHPYYWSPAPSYHQPYPIQTSYPFQEYQDKSPRWGSPPRSNITNTKTFYPIQQERKSSKVRLVIDMSVKGSILA